MVLEIRPAIEQGIQGDRGHLDVGFNRFPLACFLIHMPYSNQEERHRRTYTKSYVIESTGERIPVSVRVSREFQGALGN